MVFQPAEEGGAGAKAMLDDGLMEEFGIQEVYGMHICQAWRRAGSACVPAGDGLRR
jgi:metal-dependent amidase/aminoacylase/carboxypeptidase family protein